MAFAIETTQLSKRFGDTHALNSVDLQIAPGTVFGLLGPNGAGKTTTVRLLATLLKPSSGSASVLGFDSVKQAADIRARVALTGQFASVDDELSGVENLILMARLRGFSWGDAKRRATELLQAFNLMDARHRQVTTYSGGMRRRLDIAASLIVRPEILFLDEPTTGLDPRSRNQVWDIVRAVAQQGSTVLLTTQYLEEADQLAARLAVIDQGKLIAQGTSRELKASVGSGTLKVFLQFPEQSNEAQVLLQQLLPDETVHPLADNGLAIQVSNNTQALDALHTLRAHNIDIEEFAMGSPSLDEVFFALTGHSAAQSETTTEGAS